ncbi:MAG: hydroxyacid dehydrogenase [Hyphomicrobiales bacterium]|nr:hydroxyacid dehydrogenase [Hyphomicrobiales bacterium]
MMRIAILDDYQRLSLKLADWSRVQAQCEITVFDQNIGSIDEAARLLAPFDILIVMRERMPVPRALIERLPNLKMMVSTGTRNRGLDSAAARERGILVTHTTGLHATATTLELTWALILAAARNIPYEDRVMRAGGWQETLGMRLVDRTLGLCGFGKLGSAVAKIGQAFGMKTIAWSQNLDAARAQAGGTELVSKHELFARSDIVSVHLVLSERTRGLVGAPEFAAMRKDAIFVNTSRGPIVDEAALVDTMQRKAIRRAALDVYDVEPLPKDHPLRSMDNVVLSPHLGYASEDNVRQYYQDSVENIEAFLAGKPIRIVED